MKKMFLVSSFKDVVSVFEKFEVINLQLSQRKILRQKTFHWLFILLCAVIVIISIILIVLNGSYLDWNFNNPETAIAGTVFHAFEWLFVRLAPIILIGGIFGVLLTRKKS